MSCDILFSCLAFVYLYVYSQIVYLRCESTDPIQLKNIFNHNMPSVISLFIYSDRDLCVRYLFDIKNTLIYYSMQLTTS